MKKNSSNRKAPSYNLFPNSFEPVKFRAKSKVKKPKKVAASPPTPLPTQKRRVAKQPARKRKPRTVEAAPPQDSPGLSPVEVRAKMQQMQQDSSEMKVDEDRPDYLDGLRSQLELGLTRLEGAVGRLEQTLLGIELHNRLEANAKRRGLPFEEVLREAVQRYLEAEFVDPTTPAKDAALYPETDTPLKEAPLQRSEPKAGVVEVAAGPPVKLN